MQVNDGQREDAHEKRPNGDVYLVAHDIEHKNAQAVGKREHCQDDLNEDGGVGPEAGSHLADFRLVDQEVARNRRTNEDRTRIELW